MMDDVRAPMALLSCEGARDFAGRVASHLARPLLASHETWFACGEAKVEIEENVRGHDVYIFQNLISPGDDHSPYDRLMMLLHAADAASLADAQWVTAVLPYYPGARQDKRKGRTREGISASLVARMLKAAGVRRVLCIEVHNEAIAGMFDPRVCMLENLYLTRPLAAFLRARELCGDVVVAPDVGGMERARRYALELSASLAAISKERDYAQPNTVLRANLIGDVAGRDVLLIDDIIDTAGSVVAAVRELRENGAKNITAACTHAVLSPPAWDRLGAVAAEAQAEGWRFTVVGATSIQHPQPPPWYQEFAVESLVASVIRNINRRGSVTRVQEERAE
ncbi:MAG: ribose-phosphate diphosphokinase [Deltaproteobacteria bacterium]|nr:ribose-phosphate diphosphokinase [Deltaproteobacteria bacterium]MBK9371365.1 ribose-phosphate diphosphokinase [Deltaproteobacteria bacterium]MBK9645674.1 ribose-phosphate diphosphokinase [Deltaproteobacteria bacterium]